MIHFLHGMVVMGAATSGLFFLRFYRQARDRLFVFLAVAFFILALHWTTIAIWQPQAETKHWQFIPRLIAFLLIIVGVADKNRRA
jgi:type II secretory pathway component PulM